MASMTGISFALKKLDSTMSNCSYGDDTMHVIPSPQKTSLSTMCATPILIIWHAGHSDNLGTSRRIWPASRRPPICRIPVRCHRRPKQDAGRGLRRNCRHRRQTKVVPRFLSLPSPQTLPWRRRSVDLDLNDFQVPIIGWFDCKSVPEAVQLNLLRERPKFRRGGGSWLDSTSQRNQVESLKNCQVK